MAIEVIYIDDGRGVIIQESNVVTGKEIITAQVKIYEQHKLVRQQYHIIDKSWCTEYNVTASDIKIISDRDKKTAKLNPDIIMAVIESKSLQFSLTDIWQAHVESFIQHSKSFINKSDALVWIREILQKKAAN